MSRKRPVHPVFGTSARIKGFALSRQLMVMLDFWHSKACALLQQQDLPPKQRKRLIGVRDRIYDSAIKKQPSSGQECAMLLDLMSRQFIENGIGIGGSISPEEFAKVAKAAQRATAPIAPAKMPGPLNRGSRLTPAGLLVRYQAFLVQELETVSWHLYGARDFAMQYRGNDREVNKRCRDRPRGSDPFFDEKMLPRRARAVLKSLKIETAKVGEA